LCSRGMKHAVPTSMVVVVSAVDPVARAVAEMWGELPATGAHLDGTPIRRLRETVLVVRRPGLHVHDEELDQRLPEEVRSGRPTLVFPSIHRSERNVPCLTVHPLGNPGREAEVGGRPRTLVPSDPRRMADALRRLDEGASSLGLTATYEATHHGPALGLPAFFVEIGFGELPAPPPDAVRVLADVIPSIEPDRSDRVALGVGGGHYAPHFTDLALHRKWAFGHILSRHALEEVDRNTAREAFALSGSAEGVVFVRASDAPHPVLDGVGPRLRDQDAGPREPRERGSTTDGGRSASGT